MPKVTQQYRDARRTHLLDAARRCFLRNGFHATSMQDVFAEAGMSSGAVYRYFASKGEMIVAIVEENLHDVVAMVQDVSAHHSDRSVGGVLGDVFDILRAKHADAGLASLAVLAWGETLRDPDLAARFRQMLTEVRTELANLVSAQQARHQLAAGIPADDVASVLMSTVPGYILQLALLGDDAVAGTPGAVRALWPPSEPPADDDTK